MKKKIASLFVLVFMLIAIYPTNIMATEVGMKDVYLELVNQETGMLFEGATLEKAYYATSLEDVSFEKESEGKFKLFVDTQNHGQEFVICELSFPEGYKQVGYDMEPIGYWVNSWTEPLVVEVCNATKGSGTYDFAVWNEFGEYLDGAEISVYLYEDASDFKSKSVRLVDKAITKTVFDYEYADGKFIYDGKAYNDLLIQVDFPFGYTYEGNVVTNYACENIWYTVSEFAGQTWGGTYAEQYLDDLSVTEKEVYIQFIDAKTGEAYTDIAVNDAYYVLDTEGALYDTTMENVGEGKFKFVLEGKDHRKQTIWAEFECSEGYVFEGQEDTVFSEYVDRWFIEGETIEVSVVSNDSSVSDAAISKETITYQFLDEEKKPVETVDLKVWLSDTVGPKADLTLIYESTNSTGEVPIEFTDTEYVYNGKTYQYLIYEGLFLGYHTWYEPANGYIGGINTYYNLKELKEADFQWIWNLEKYEEEKFETEPTEETFTYEFVTEDGTVVDGTKVRISLCNEMESVDKVVIVESTSGEGEFTIAHMGDFYYNENLTYNYLEISYSFPKGYVLADSEGLTGATVYYSVSDLCNGGDSIVWLLEKVNDIIVEIPETDSEKNNAVVELPEEKDEISKEIMDTILETNKTFDVEIKSNNDVIFSFKAGEMKHVDGKTSYDFGVKIETDFSSLENAPFEEKDFVLRINYDYSGELPGNAQISIPVGNKWIGKMLYYYQILADGTYKYTGEKAVVDDKGMYTIHQNHCSDYVISAVEPKETNDMSGTNDANNSNNTEQNVNNTENITQVSPKTGDYGWTSCLSLFIIVFGSVVLKKASLKNTK